MDDVVIQELWDPEQAQSVRSRIGRVSPQKVDRQKNLERLNGVHEAIGGFDRLAFVANDDPKWFYNRFGHRLLPDEKEELDVNISIHPALPRSALDGEFVEVAATDVTPNAIGVDGSAPPGDSLSRGWAPSESGDPAGPDHSTGQDDGGRTFFESTDQEAGGSGPRS